MSTPHPVAATGSATSSMKTPLLIIAALMLINALGLTDLISSLFPILLPIFIIMWATKKVVAA